MILNRLLSQICLLGSVTCSIAAKPHNTTGDIRETTTWGSQHPQSCGSNQPLCDPYEPTNDTEHPLDRMFRFFQSNGIKVSELGYQEFQKTYDVYLRMPRDSVVSIRNEYIAMQSNGSFCVVRKPGLPHYSEKDNKTQQVAVKNATISSGVHQWKTNMGPKITPQPFIKFKCHGGYDHCTVLKLLPACPHIPLTRVNASETLFSSTGIRHWSTVVTTGDKTKTLPISAPTSSKRPIQPIKKASIHSLSHTNTSSSVSLLEKLHQTPIDLNLDQAPPKTSSHQDKHTSITSTPNYSQPYSTTTNTYKLVEVTKFFGTTTTLTVTPSGSTPSSEQQRTRWTTLASAQTSSGVVNKQAVSVEYTTVVSKLSPTPTTLSEKGYGRV